MRIQNPGILGDVAKIDSSQGGVGDAEKASTLARQNSGDARSATPPLPARLTYTKGASNKFYELSVEGSELVIKNGRIGTAGVEHRKSFADEAGATREMARRQDEKLAKGYVMERGTVLDAQVAAAKAVKAARADAAAPVAEVAAPQQESEYPIVRNLADWNALSESDREQVLDDMEYFPERYPHLTSIADVDENKIATAITDPAQQKFAHAMIAKLNDLGLETDSDYYPTVGDPQMRVNVYALKTGEVIGGYVHAFQLGAMSDDGDESGHYDTVEEAEKAGFSTDHDVSWSASARLDNNLEFVGDEPYIMEWSGH